MHAIGLQGLLLGPLPQSINPRQNPVWGGVRYCYCRANLQYMKPTDQVLHFSWSNVYVNERRICLFSEVVSSVRKSCKVRPCRDFILPKNLRQSFKRTFSFFSLLFSFVDKNFFFSGIHDKTFSNSPYLHLSPFPVESDLLSTPSLRPKPFRLAILTSKSKF